MRQAKSTQIQHDLRSSPAIQKCPQLGLEGAQYLRKQAVDGRLGGAYRGCVQDHRSHKAYEPQGQGRARKIARPLPLGCLAAAI